MGQSETLKSLYTPPPPSQGIHPKVSCNENSKGKIYDENTSKKIFFLTLLPHPFPPSPLTLTIPHLKVDPRIFQQNFYSRIFLGKKYFKLKFFWPWIFGPKNFIRPEKNFDSIFFNPKFNEAKNFIGPKNFAQYFIGPKTKGFFFLKI